VHLVTHGDAMSQLRPFDLLDRPAAARYIDDAAVEEIARALTGAARQSR